ncbi:MAG TPA: LeuA family protein [Herpetosiphonaceae bacterium]
MDENTLIYDWNAQGAPRYQSMLHVADETLRDGLQSPSVIDPPIDKKLEILHLMVELGIHCADIGLPGASERQYRDVERLAREVVEQRLPLDLYVACRTLRSDIEPAVRVSAAVGRPIEVAAFLGSSPIRQYAEGWTVDQLLKLTEEAVSYAVAEGLPVMYVTEDTTRADPETLRRLYTLAVECGARRVCISDTVGHATPEGTAALVGFVREVVDATGEHVLVDWHGHRDRSLDIANCFAAYAAGADRTHGAALGIGERCGNTPIEVLLVNMKLAGMFDHDLAKLPEYGRVVSEALGVPIPVNYPVLGADAFRTATGVHAAAVIKAQHKGDDWLADRIYSGVPAGMIGRSQLIEIGPMSGASNVRFWLEQRGLPVSDEIIAAVIAAAKRSSKLLAEEEIRAIAGEEG